MNAIMKVINELGNRSCLTNILENWNMGPSTYDIICPNEATTEVYVLKTSLTDIDKDSEFIENSLSRLLTFIEKKLLQNELIFIPFNTPIIRKESDFNIKLNLTEETQKHYARLSQGWIIPA